MAKAAQPKADREIIETTNEIELGAVIMERATDKVRVLAAAIIAGASLLLGSAFLATAIYTADQELRAWATGLISLVVGAAIGFIFSGTGNNQS